MTTRSNPEVNTITSLETSITHTRSISEPELSQNTKDCYILDVSIVYGGRRFSYYSGILSGYYKRTVIWGKVMFLKQVNTKNYTAIKESVRSKLWEIVVFSNEGESDKMFNESKIFFNNAVNIKCPSDLPSNEWQGHGELNNEKNSPIKLHNNIKISITKVPNLNRNLSSKLVPKYYNNINLFLKGDEVDAIYNNDWLISDTS